MTVREQLIAARAKVDAGWTQGVFARDANGSDLLIAQNFEGAVCFCASGALKAIGADTFGPAYKALSAAVGHYFISNWNDEPKRTKEEVLAGFDKAIAAQDALQVVV